MTETPMTLTEFLLARITEDEAVANEVRRFEHLSTRDSCAVTRIEKGRAPYATCGVTSGRVLAECEAKRDIIQHVTAGWPPDGEGSDSRRILKNLALPHADHPDYHEEWRP